MHVLLIAVVLVLLCGISTMVYIFHNKINTLEEVLYLLKKQECQISFMRSDIEKLLEKLSITSPKVPKKSYEVSNSLRDTVPQILHDLHEKMESMKAFQILKNRRW